MWCVSTTRTRPENDSFIQGGEREVGVKILYYGVVSLAFGVIVFEVFIAGVVVACVWMRVCP